MHELKSPISVGDKPHARCTRSTWQASDSGHTSASMLSSMHLSSTWSARLLTRVCVMVTNSRYTYLSLQCMSGTNKDMLTLHKIPRTDVQAIASMMSVTVKTNFFSMNVFGVKLLKIFAIRYTVRQTQEDEQRWRWGSSTVMVRRMVTAPCWSTGVCVGCSQCVQRWSRLTKKARLVELSEIDIFQCDLTKIKYSYEKLFWIFTKLITFENSWFTVDTDK